MCYILCMTRSSSMLHRASGGFEGKKFASGNMSHFPHFYVTSIFMSIVGRFFSTWFLPMVFYFLLRN
jgi:hypothetical protein